MTASQSTAETPHWLALGVDAITDLKKLFLNCLAVMIGVLVIADLGLSMAKFARGSCKGVVLFHKKVM